MANNKSKKAASKKSSKSSKPVESKAKTTKDEASEVEITATINVDGEEKTVELSSKDKSVEIALKDDEEETTGNPLKGFFACKHDEKETVLTIFKNPRIYGAILGELVGTMIVTMVLLSLGLYQPLYIMFAVLAVTAAVYGISGANLNPIVTIGMMATRRISAIRGVLYMLAQILGAWLGFVVINAFHSAGGEGASELTAVSSGEIENFWICTFIEFAGAILIAFFFARAVVYKKNQVIFATAVGAGVCIALLFAIMVSGYAGLQNNFALNPAAALTFQILPSQGEFGELIGQVAQSLTTYWIFPLLGGVVGFYLSDFMGRLSGEKTCCCKKK